MSGTTLTRRGLTIAAATLAPLALWTLTGPVAGLDPSAESGGRAHPVGAVAVVAASLVMGLAAWALLALLERTTGNPRRAWTITAVAVLALSLTGPLGSAADTASLAVLTAMHLLVAAILIPGLAPSARPRRAR
ncbi:DUF6069 family protein [Actinomadura latina]|uniref:Uncharacterized protein n=1 Tax=Actinomadura latina TaxID=163603 RepID=A0A846ZGF2_9ACTN|nr:DUF6069 family protein [Actinomadura latina]NKZ09266.1 hypothetical protein [Actinomadura latina]